MDNVIPLRRDRQTDFMHGEPRAKRSMNRFGEIADELSELIEELETSSLAPDSTVLCRALQRAFVQACLAEQSMRRRGEGPRSA